MLTFDLSVLQVGKTTLISQFLTSSPPLKYHKTVEELHISEYKLMDGNKLVLEILDTAGSFEFPAMRNLNILNSDAFIVVWGGASSDNGRELVS